MISRGKPLSNPSGLAIRKAGRRDGAGGASVDCPLCGPSVARELVAKEFPYQRRLCACEGCGIVRMIAENPFGRDYWEDDALGLDVYDNHEVRAEMRRRYARYLPVITRFCGRTGALLDVGCGIGNFLLAARDAGWQVAGTEASAKAAAVARSRGLKVETARLEESRHPPGTFDAISLWDVIPHLEDPAVGIRALHRMLKPGGVVFLETPDENFVLRSALRRAFALSQGRIDLLEYVYRPEHRFYFTAVTLPRVLERGGFRTVALWRDVTSPAKAHRKVAASRFPLSRLVLPFLSVSLEILRPLGIGNKLMLAAQKA